MFLNAKYRHYEHRKDRTKHEQWYRHYRPLSWDMSSFFYTVFQHQDCRGSIHPRPPRQFGQGEFFDDQHYTAGSTICKVTVHFLIHASMVHAWTDVRFTGATTSCHKSVTARQRIPNPWSWKTLVSPNILFRDWLEARTPVLIPILPWRLPIKNVWIIGIETWPNS